MLQIRSISNCQSNDAWLCARGCSLYVRVSNDIGDCSLPVSGQPFVHLSGDLRLDRSGSSQVGCWSGRTRRQRAFSELHFALSKPNSPVPIRKASSIHASSFLSPLRSHRESWLPTVICLSITFRFPFISITSRDADGCRCYCCCSCRCRCHHCRRVSCDVISCCDDRSSSGIDSGTME